MSVSIEYFTKDHVVSASGSYQYESEWCDSTDGTISVGYAWFPDTPGDKFYPKYVIVDGYESLTHNARYGLVGGDFEGSGTLRVFSCAISGATGFNLTQV
jgi:hypothetical protein